MKVHVSCHLVLDLFNPWLIETAACGTGVLNRPNVMSVGSDKYYYSSVFHNYSAGILF